MTIFLLAIAVFAMIITALIPQFTGFLIHNSDSYEVLILDQKFIENQTLDLAFVAPLTALRMSGTVTGNGILEVILTNQTDNWTVYSLDTQSVNHVTALAIRRTEMIMSIDDPVFDDFKEPGRILLVEPEENITINISENITINVSEEIIEIINNTFNVTINETLNETLQEEKEKPKFEELVPEEVDSAIEDVLVEPVVLEPISEPIEEIVPDDYGYVLDNYCQDSCFLPEVENLTLEIIIDGDMEFNFQDLTYQLLYPVKQKKDLPDHIIQSNQITTVNLGDYYNHSQNLLFDLPLVVGMNASIINDDILLLSGNQPGDYSLFVYATNGKDLQRSNEFTVSIIPEINVNLSETLNLTLNESLNVINETLNNTLLSQDILDELSVQGKARILVRTSDNSLLTPTRGFSTQDISLEDAKEMRKDSDVYFHLEKKDQNVKVKQLADSYAALELNQEQITSLLEQNNVEEIILDTAFSPLVSDALEITNTTYAHSQNWVEQTKKYVFLILEQRLTF